MGFKDFIKQYKKEIEKIKPAKETIEESVKKALDNYKTTQIQNSRDN
jgi:hypothetical protein